MNPKVKTLNHFSATEHRSNAFKNRMKILMRIQYVALIALVGTILTGFTGLIYALLK